MKKKKKKIKKSQSKQLTSSVKKGYLAQSPINEMQQGIEAKSTGRGYKVITLSRLRAETGINKLGQYETVSTDIPIFYLLPEERERLMQLVTPLQGIITSRMNVMASSDFKITWDKKNMDREYEKYVAMRQTFTEFKRSSDFIHLVANAKILLNLKSRFPELLNDMSNFDNVMLRWKKHLQFQNDDVSDAIKDRLLQPNKMDTWRDFIKKWTKDFLLHGSSVIYKTKTGNQIDSLDVLPGGTVIPWRPEYVQDQAIWIQFSTGRVPQIFRPDELSVAQYIPTSFRSYGLVPIEALINKLTETLLFDRLMAEHADGSKYPGKMVIINDISPFGDPDQQMLSPMNHNDQKRIEKKTNERIESGIMTFTGNGVEVVDISKSDTMPFQNDRQKDIRDEIALLFNASDIEANLIGAKKFSSNDSAGAQQDVADSRGILPIKRSLEDEFNYDILPELCPPGYTFEFDKQKNEREEVEQEQRKVNTNTYSTNQIRIARGDMPYPEKIYDRPSQDAANNEGNPLSIRNVNGA